jgi:hypothetical protein
MGGYSQHEDLSHQPILLDPAVQERLDDPVNMALADANMLGNLAQRLSLAMTIHDLHNLTVRDLPRPTGITPTQIAKPSRQRRFLICLGCQNITKRNLVYAIHDRCPQHVGQHIRRQCLGLRCRCRIVADTFERSVMMS